MKWLLDIWLRPLIDIKPEHMSLTEYLETMFQLDKRIIVDYIVKRKTSVPGDYLEHEMHRVKGVKVKRKLLVGDYITVRICKEDIWIDVETDHGIFRLKPLEWERLKLDLRPRYRNRPRHPLS